MPLPKQNQTEYSSFTEAMRKIAALTAEAGKKNGASSEDIERIIADYRRKVRSEQ